MTRNELDKRLRQLNTFEEELLDLPRRDVKLRFSGESPSSQWKISGSKLMEDSEHISIHKHDRFIAFDEHNHDYIELMYVYDGSIRHQIMGQEVVLSKGEILLMDMNVKHRIEPAELDDIAVNILIRREFFDSFFMQHIAYGNIITGFIVNAIYNQEDKEQFLHLKTGGDQKIMNLVLAILEEYYEGKNGMDTAIMGNMLLLFNEIIRNYQDYLSETSRSKVDSAIVVDIVYYIDQNYKTLTLKEMAKHFNYHFDYLGKQIKKLTGRTLKELVKVRKLREAERLLSTTDMSIQDIMEVINYANASYFYKQFKAEFGMTPHEYRQDKGDS